MKYQFKTTLQGVEIDETIEGETPEEIIRLLREKLSDRVLKRGFFRFRVGNIIKGLDPRKKNAWSDIIFFAQVTKYYNEHAKQFPCAVQNVECPSTCKEFLQVAEKLGMAVKL
jgi:hypothetical protein